MSGDGTVVVAGGKGRESGAESGDQRVPDRRAHPITLAMPCHPCLWDVFPRGLRGLRGLRAVRLVAGGTTLVFWARSKMRGPFLFRDGGLGSLR